VRSVPVLVVTSLVTSLVLLLNHTAHADGDEPAAEKNQGKEAVKEFNQAFAALKNKEATVEELRNAKRMANNCGVDIRSLRSMRKNVSSSDPTLLYDADKEMLLTDAGKLSLKQVEERCKAMETELDNKKVSGCGTKTIMVQQELVGRRQWSAVEDHVSEGFRQAPCDEFPKKNQFPGGSKAFAARFKKLCGKGAVYVVDDSTWHNYEDAGRVYRNYSGRCWEKNVSLSSR
jgi:hypothetical protein